MGSKCSWNKQCKNVAPYYRILFIPLKMMTNIYFIYTVSYEVKEKHCFSCCHSLTPAIKPPTATHTFSQGLIPCNRDLGKQTVSLKTSLLSSCPPHFVSWAWCHMAMPKPAQVDSSKTSNFWICSPSNGNTECNVVIFSHEVPFTSANQGTPVRTSFLIFQVDPTSVITEGCKAHRNTSHGFPIPG